MLPLEDVREATRNRERFFLGCAVTLFSRPEVDDGSAADVSWSDGGCCAGFNSSAECCDNAGSGPGTKQYVSGIYAVGASATRGWLPGGCCAAIVDIEPAR